MNVIPLMPPLSLIKRLKMCLEPQATFLFFCATSVVQLLLFLLILISYDW